MPMPFHIRNSKATGTPPERSRAAPFVAKGASRLSHSFDSELHEVNRIRDQDQPDFRWMKGDGPPPKNEIYTIRRTPRRMYGMKRSSQSL
jgi:hypothetical protein